MEEAYPELPEPKLEQLKIAMEFINELRAASHENSGLPDEVRHGVLHPIQEAFQIDDPDHHLSLEIYLATANGSRESYNLITKAVERRNPSNKLLSYSQISRRVEAWSGVHLVRDDMCLKGCVGFTGPFKDLLQCPTCHEHRYDQVALAASKKKKQIPRQQFYSLLLGPQIQAQWAHTEGAKAMRYGANQMKANLAEITKNGGCPLVYTDIFSGSALLERFTHEIKEDDTMVLFSVDGAQLYRNKQSDMWMGIFTLLNLPPEQRYKNSHILPAVFIPGPYKPKNTDSFFFRVFHHASILMKEGVQVWDAAQNRQFCSKLHLILATADGPGLTCLDGGVGHQGAHGCRLHCPMHSRLKTSGSGYYPALQLPGHGYSTKVPGSAHPDVDPGEVAEWEVSSDNYLANIRQLLKSRTRAEYRNNRLATGLVKPSLILGLPTTNTLGVPGVFSLDMMHLPALNAPDTLIPLWRGLFTRENNDQEDWPWAENLSQHDMWKEHGAQVAAARPYLPTWFDQAPRNPAEKINSGYKAWDLHFFACGFHIHTGGTSASWFVLFTSISSIRSHRKSYKKPQTFSFSLLRSLRSCM